MELHLPFALTIFGKPGQGKSTLIKYVMNRFHPKFTGTRKDFGQYFDFGIVMCGTSFNNGYDYLPRNKVYGEFNIEVLERLMAFQKTAGNHKKYNAFVVLDDCLNKKGFEDPRFIKLITQFRHYNISMILATQYPTLIPSYMRNCCTHVAIFRETNRNAFNALYGEYGMAYGSTKEFNDFLQAATGDHKFVFLKTAETAEDNKSVYRVMRCPAKLTAFEYKF